MKHAQQRPSNVGASRRPSRRPSERPSPTGPIDLQPPEFPKRRPSVMIQSVTDGMSSLILNDRPIGWKLVQKSLPRILEYGRSEGILQMPEHPSFDSGINLTGIVEAAREEANAHIPKNGDKVSLPTNDISLMHEAIPFLPVPVAIVCLILNVIIPGSGTILCGICALCMGQPRINMKEGRKIVTLIVNFMVGVSQFFTITFLLVGWFWSIAWGGLIITHSMQYREALQQRRQEAVATAAIEALTKDSILHRRDVKTLVRAHKTDIQNQTKKQSMGILKFGKSEEEKK
uniref:Protein SPEC3 n=1 Tax=Plectus sambesii TaxID=2011161 RepID=A0A914UJK4_9BILA